MDTPTRWPPEKLCPGTVAEERARESGAIQEFLVGSRGPRRLQSPPPPPPRGPRPPAGRNPGWNPPPPPPGQRAGDLKHGVRAVSLLHTEEGSAHVPRAQCLLSLDSTGHALNLLLLCSNADHAHLGR